MGRMSPDGTASAIPSPKAQGNRDAQETVQGAWLARLEPAEGAQRDPGVSGERLLRHVPGKA